MKTDIYIVGEINEDAFVEFDKVLSSLEKKREEISVLLISEGGCAKVAMAFFDRIKLSRSDIIITVTGSAESAAVLILAAGDYRRMTQNAWVMVHEDSIEGIENSKTSELEKVAKHFRRMEDQWCTLLAGVTEVDMIEWSRLHKKETYLTAQECLALGLIEDIMVRS